METRLHLSQSQTMVIIEASQVLMAMTTFSVMAASSTSHHAMYHYSFFGSLTMVVFVGVLGFLGGLALIAVRFLHLVDPDLRDKAEFFGMAVMAGLCYTSAVASSATSTDLHTTFETEHGPWCAPRHHRGRAMAAAHFCSHLVAATVLMYLLALNYAAAFVYLLSSRRSPITSSSSSSGDYDDIEAVPLTTPPQGTE